MYEFSKMFQHSESATTTAAVVVCYVKWSKMAQIMFCQSSDHHPKFVWYINQYIYNFETAATAIVFIYYVKTA